MPIHNPRNHTPEETIEYTVARYAISAGTNADNLRPQDFWMVETECGLRVTAVRREGAAANRKVKYSASRVYGALDALVPSLVALEPFRTEAIPFKPVEPEDKVKAAMWAAWRNGTTKRGRELLVPLLRTTAGQLSLPTAFIGGLRFSAYAGCECPCSPGYIMDANWDRCDLWISRVDEVDS